MKNFMSRPCETVELVDSVLKVQTILTVKKVYCDIMNHNVIMSHTHTSVALYKYFNN